ncbi:hypothetical protein SK128_023675 [Halocaridina rubra]|uniref:C2H2-type domain-containing protein n=1 Tax=Halocaridina rubra TaxID=373956 RepID=A0AAN9FU68_HALRR
MNQKKRVVEYMICFQVNQGSGIGGGDEVLCGNGDHGGNGTVGEVRNGSEMSSSLEWHQLQQHQQLLTQEQLLHKPDGHLQFDLHHLLDSKRPYMCKFCGKWFATPSKVVRHERTHTGERPYVCSQCTLSFNQKEILKRHMRSVHKVTTTW